MFQLERHGPSAVFRSDRNLLRISFPAEGTARITYTQGKPFIDRPSRVVLAQQQVAAFEIREEAGCYSVFTAKLRVEVSKAGYHAYHQSYYYVDKSFMENHVHGVSASFFDGL